MQNTRTFVIVSMVTLSRVEMVHGDGQVSQGAIYIDTWTSPWYSNDVQVVDLSHCFAH